MAKLWPSELDDCPRGKKWPSVDRATVFRVGTRACEPMGAIETCVAALVWGTGTKTRDVGRRVMVFDKGSDFGADLAGAVRTLLSEGPVAAYGALHGSGNVVKYLGPSFGTKVLYFAGYDRATGSRKPLILDSNVARALNRLCGLNWPTDESNKKWTSSQYADYLDLAHAWARDWGTEPDVIERVLFEIGKASPLVVRVLTGRPLIN